MGTLRYASASSDGTRLWDAIEERYFITEKKAVENLNAKLELAAEMVEQQEQVAAVSTYASDRIRALKENV